MKNLTVCREETELAKAEPPIAASDLLMEVLPLMQEYFIGEIRFEKASIVYRLPNGQNFRITAQQQ